jgi:hypothetical protein
MSVITEYQDQRRKQCNKNISEKCTPLEYNFLLSFC